MRDRTDIKLVATDLDGTLLRHNKSVSETDWNKLIELESRRITRVVATGRSLFKVKEVLPENIPIDYVVFSSGAGIYNWRNDELLHREFFSEATTRLIISYLLKGNYNFFVYQPIPKNNLFHYHQGAEKCSEFENYKDRHSGDFEKLNVDNYHGNAGQIMAVIPNSTQLFEGLKAEIESACEGVRVIRTTSPVNDNYIWLEIFPDTVSKGHGIKWLCDYLKIEYSETVGIGNDYNDLDMFEFVAFPYVLGNGVEMLRNQFHSIEASNENSGFSEVLKLLLP